MSVRGLVVAAVMVLATGRASAYPQFQLSRDQTCSGCHLSPAGGGLLSENGLNTADAMSQFGTSPEFMYGKLPLAGRPPRPVPVTHRVTGFALFALTVPVAVHCLIAYGVQLTSLRVAVHSVAGCFFYGAFTAKVLLVRSRRLPGWALPAAGGMLAIIVGVLWYTSALWYYNGYRLPHL